MHRRTVIVLAASIPLAGCNALTGGDTLLDSTLSSEDPHGFSADDGDELSITVGVEEIDDVEDDDIDHHPTSVSVQISREGTPIFAESVEEELEDTISIEDGGQFDVVVSGGTAHVTIERT